MVAGVGSSVVGTAALARNVADAYDINVAGVVSGYGLADVVLEALGGWYFYGKIDQFRYELENGLTNLNAFLSKMFAHGTDAMEVLRNYEFPLDDIVPPSMDVQDLTELLLIRYVHGTPSLNVKLLVGHSKGNLLISSALNHINNEIRAGLGDEKYRGEDHSMQNLAVVTLGAVVDLPTKLIKQENQHQFLGRLDLLGRANSRSFGGDLAANVTRIDGSGHHLNTKIPGYLDVKAVLKEYVPDLPKISVKLTEHEKKRELLFRQV